MKQHPVQRWTGPHESLLYPETAAMSRDFWRSPAGTRSLPFLSLVSTRRAAGRRSGRDEWPGHSHYAGEAVPRVKDNVTRARRAITP